MSISERVIFKKIKHHSRLLLKGLGFGVVVTRVLVRSIVRSIVHSFDPPNAKPFCIFEQVGVVGILNKERLNNKKNAYPFCFS